VFARYAKSLVDAKRLEVCATTLPQKVLPKIFADARYHNYLTQRANIYGQRAEKAYDIFCGVKGVVAPKPAGAFYFSVVFEEEALNMHQSLPVENPKVKECIEAALINVSKDKRFVYYLMASTGICVVPLSGFNSHFQGFRMTLLEPDEKKFTHVLHTIAKAIDTYLASSV